MLFFGTGVPPAAEASQTKLLRPGRVAAITIQSSGSARHYTAICGPRVIFEHHHQALHSRTCKWPPRTLLWQSALTEAPSHNAAAAHGCLHAAHDCHHTMRCKEDGVLFERVEALLQLVGTVENAFILGQQLAGLVFVC